MNRRQPKYSLDERSRDILEAIVRLNIETGRAVSSGLIERYLQRSVSSATMRISFTRFSERTNIC